MADPGSSLTGIAGTTAAGAAVAGPWGALAGLGVGLVGAGLSWLTGDRAAELRKQAALERARRADVMNRIRLGEGTAAAGASGLQFGGVGGVQPGESSMALHLATMAQEFRRENEFNVKQAQQGADLDQLANAINAGANVGGSFFRYADSQKWWMGPST